MAMANPLIYRRLYIYIYIYTHPHWNLHVGSSLAMFDYIHLSCKITQRYAWSAILRKVIHSDYLIPKSHPCGLLRTLADQASCWSIWWGKPSIYGFKFTLGLILLGWNRVSFFYPSKRTGWVHLINGVDPQVFPHITWCLMVEFLLMFKIHGWDMLRFRFWWWSPCFLICNTPPTTVAHHDLPLRLLSLNTI